MRCGRVLTSTWNASHAFCRSANVWYSGSRFASVGTRSALLTRTAASLPPFDAGSAGRQVCTVTV